MASSTPVNRSWSGFGVSVAITRPPRRAGRRT
ncbi:MAG: hypothetical protein F2667_12570 [Actinobacteria bacterium]|nr:hypothetical protein [Actinomycetota bacterium]